MDIAGIDVLAHVARNLGERLDPGDRAEFTLPPLVEDMIARGWLGAKTGQGFYRKDADGAILTLDPATMSYRPKQAARFGSVDAARSIENTAERLRTLFAAGRRSDAISVWEDVLGRSPGNKSAEMYLNLVRDMGPNKEAANGGAVE